MDGRTEGRRRKREWWKRAERAGKALESGRRWLIGQLKKKEEERDGEESREGRIRKRE